MIMIFKDFFFFYIPFNYLNYDIFHILNVFNIDCGMDQRNFRNEVLHELCTEK